MIRRWEFYLFYEVLFAETEMIQSTLMVSRRL